MRSFRRISDELRCVIKIFPLTKNEIAKTEHTVQTQK